jgi:succinate dehydrogenase / fumarate reductase, flavoprotein subunit
MTSPAYKLIDHSYDVVVVGAGGSGLRATMGGGSGQRTPEIFAARETGRVVALL